MNKKYERYINYIVNDLEAPYFKNMKEMYGLRPDEYGLVLSKIYNQPVTIKGYYVYNVQGNEIYSENSYGDWYRKEYDEQGNMTYFEESDGYWFKREYDDQGNKVYYENSDGEMEDNR